MYSGYMLWKRLANRESLLTRFGVSLRFATFMRQIMSMLVIFILTALGTS